MQMPEAFVNAAWNKHASTKLQCVFRIHFAVLWTACFRLQLWPKFAPHRVSRGKHPPLGRFPRSPSGRSADRRYAHQSALDLADTQLPDEVQQKHQDLKLSSFGPHSRNAVERNIFGVWTPDRLHGPGQELRSKRRLWKQWEWSLSSARQGFQWLPQHCKAVRSVIREKCWEHRMDATLK